MAATETNVSAQAPAPIPPWCAPPRELVLSAASVHIWRANLDMGPEAVARLAGYLSPSERERAGRFHFERDCLRYSAGRGVLRVLLGRYLKIPPLAIQFSYGAHGKPYIDSGVSFNLSHSHGLALYAFGERTGELGELGIDVERLDLELDIEDIAENFFTWRELAEIRALPAGRRHERFFDFWTRKEAYLKGRGGGLSIPLNEFEVSQGARLEGWSVLGLAPGPGYAGALVTTYASVQLRCFNWDEWDRSPHRDFAPEIK